MRRTFHHLCLIFTLLVPLLAAGGPARAAPEAAASGDFWTLCRDHVSAAENRFALPAHLLYAIARAESGRWHPASKANLAWPWTVMAEGRGRFLPSKAAAIAEVEALRARGIRNIDVGCMQVNLHHHAKAFASLEEAFDPATNAAYAAGFLKDLRQEARSWTRAIGHYHSRTPKLGNRYRHKVQRLWRDERHRANDRRRQARVLSAARDTAAVEAPQAMPAAPKPQAKTRTPQPRASHALRPARKPLAMAKAAPAAAALPAATAHPVRGAIVVGSFRFTAFN